MECSRNTYDYASGAAHVGAGNDGLIGAGLGRTWRQRGARPSTAAEHWAGGVRAPANEGRANAARAYTAHDDLGVARMVRRWIDSRTSLCTRGVRVGRVSWVS